MRSDRSTGVLVTGGAGFIGRALSRRAEIGDERWVAVDTMNPRTHESAERPGGLAASAEFIVGDITDEAVWDMLLSTWRPRAVVHLAAETDTSLSLDHPTRFTRANVDGTAQMLEAFRRHQVEPERILLASSRAVYGEGGWRNRASGEVHPRPQRGASQLADGAWDFADADPVASTAGSTRELPTNIYGVTKWAQEGLLAAWCGARHTQLITLRLQNVYGPGQSLRNPYTGILALFVRLAAAGQSIPVFEDGGMLRDFVHIDDVADVFARALVSPPLTPLPIVADIGTGSPHSVLEIARIISAELDAPEPTVTGDFRNGDIRHAWCTVDRAARLWDWTPTIPVEQGVADYVGWYVNGRATS